MFTMDALSLFRSVALLNALIVILVDVKFYTPNPWRWYTAYTHWNFVAVTIHFFSQLFLDPMPSFHAAAFANTVSVNVGYWGVLYAAGWSDGKSAGQSKSMIEPPGTTKHGGSLLWLIGEWLLSGQSALSIKGPPILPPLCFSFAYLAFMNFDHYFVVFPKWEPYGDILGRAKAQLMFAIGPMIYCMVLYGFPAVGLSTFTKALAFVMLVLPAMDFARRAYAKSLIVEDDSVKRTTSRVAHEDCSSTKTQSHLELYLLGKDYTKPKFHLNHSRTSPL